MTQLTIIGASRGVGLLAVKRALEKGHKVVALSQTLSSLHDHPNLMKIKGSATNSADVAEAIEGSAAVLVCIGTSSIKRTTLFTDAASAILAVLNDIQSQVPLIVLTGFGAGASKAYQSWSAKILLTLLLDKVYDNKTAMEETITSRYTNWEIVRPGRLTNKPATGHWKAYLKLEKGMKIGAIARADVADFMILQAERPTMMRSYVGLTAAT